MARRMAPAAALLQAARRAEHRARLLRSGTGATLQQLAEATGSPLPEISAEIDRLREVGDLVAVELPGTLVVPLVQLDDQLRPDPDVAALTRRLVRAGLSGWAVWTWWHTASPRLDGRIPADLVADEQHDLLGAGLDAFLQGHRGP